jgi:predicted nucleic acid-binding protein
MTTVLIDTDVILDFFFDREPFSNDAAKILSPYERNEIKGYVTPVIISNVYYLLRKETKHEKVIEKLKMLLSITDVLIINKQTVLQAMHSDFNDFEDALQNFSAENNPDVDIIITRNTKDYKNSALSVLTPESYIKTRIIANPNKE